MSGNAEASAKYGDITTIEKRESALLAENMLSSERGTCVTARAVL